MSKSNRKNAFPVDSLTGLPAEQTAAAAAFDVPESTQTSQNVKQAEAIVARALEATDPPPVSQTAPIVPPNPVPALPVPARQGDDGRPYCPVHQCLMRANGTRGNVTTYACVVPTCEVSEKRARPQVRIAKEPIPCPMKTCVESPRGPQQFLEFDAARSNLAILHMECPKCKYALKVPRQSAAGMLDRARKRPERDDLSQR